MKLKYIILILLILIIILIHINSLAFPHSVVLRHLILLLFIGITCYIAYDSRRKYIEKYEKLRKFMKICAWCNKVCYIDFGSKEEKWITFEEYMLLEYKFTSSHGICPKCFHNIDIDLDNN